MIKERILAWARNRKPDFIIGGAEDPYLRRHWLIPRNRFFNIYVHEFIRSDDDRALHDHPWLFNASWLIDGMYVEHTQGVGRLNQRLLMAGAFKFRWGRAPHRVELILGKEDDGSYQPQPCWTVFITGPRIRDWGFYCKHGWIHWEVFCDPADGGKVGQGCPT